MQRKPTGRKKDFKTYSMFNKHLTRITVDGKEVTQAHYVY